MGHWIHTVSKLKAINFYVGLLNIFALVPIYTKSIYPRVILATIAILQSPCTTTWMVLAWLCCLCTG